VKIVQNMMLIILNTTLDMKILIEDNDRSLSSLYAYGGVPEGTPRFKFAVFCRRGCYFRHLLVDI
jgi:hypothetical protein